MFPLMSHSQNSANNVLKFKISSNICEIKFKERNNKQATYQTYKQRLPPGTHASGVIVNKGLVSFIIADPSQKNILFVAKASCIIDSSQTNNARTKATQTRRNHLYAKFSPFFFNEPLRFNLNDGDTDSLTSTKYGASLGLGYEMGTGTFTAGIEALPLFAKSQINNSDNANRKINYNGKSIVLGASFNLIGHYWISENLTIGPYLPLMIKKESFSENDVGEIAETGIRWLYGAGFYTRYSFRGLRTGIQFASLLFKPSFFVGLSLELEL